MDKSVNLGYLPDIIKYDTSDNVGIGVAPGGTAKLEVSGAIKQSVTSTMLKSNASGILVAAIANTDYQGVIGYTPANDTSVVHLANSETITGYKQFDNAVTINNNRLTINQGSGSYTDNVLSLNASGAIGEYGSQQIVISDKQTTYPYYKKTISFRSSIYTNNFNITFPDASGTVALTGDLSSYQLQLNGTGFVKASGTTISYDNSTYYLASNPSGYVTSAGSVAYATSAGSATDSSKLPLAGGTLSGNLIIYADFACSGEVYSGFRIKTNGWFIADTVSKGIWNTATGAQFYSPDSTSWVSNYNIIANGVLLSSDMRLKDMVEIVQEDAISTITFSWKNKKDDKLHWGYSAQQVQTVMKDAVHLDHTGHLTVDYAQVHTYKIAQLEKRISELENILKNK